MTHSVTNATLRLLPSWPESNADDRNAAMAGPVARFDAFREITDNAPQGIMIHRGLRPLYINRAWAELHGLTVAEAMSMESLLDLIHESERQRLLDYADGRLAGAEVPNRYRYRAIHKSGRLFWVEQFVRIVDWNGQPFIQSTIIDVDDQERQADELRQQRLWMKQEVVESSKALIQSNERLHIYRSVLDQMSERVTVIGTDYRFRMCNRANAQFRGLNANQLVGKHIRETMGDIWFEQHGKPMLDRAFAGRKGQVEKTERGPDGRRYHVEVAAEPFREPCGRVSGAIVSVRDVTAAKQAEEQLRLFASMIDQVSDRISVVDRDYRFRLTNKANLKFHQTSLDAILGQHLAETIGKKRFEEVAKPDYDRCFKGETVRARRWVNDSQGESRMLDILLEPYREARGDIVGAISTIRDITEAHQLSERLAYQARFDQLTGLVNRRAFEQLLESSIAETASGGRSDALCFIDLDQFKMVNDTVGHLVGDRLLQQVAQLFASKLHRDDVLARLGGDEFGLLLRGCSLRRAKRAGERLIAALKDFQFFHEDLVFEVGASIGITAINRHVSDASDVMAHADLACYAAKDNGRNCVQIFEKRDVVMRRRREEMYRAGGIRAALDEDRFVLFGQPIAPVKSDGGGAGRVEILLRMRDARGNLIMPSAFIPAAERYGFMADLDRWVISKTIAELLQPGTSLSGTDVCINLSGVTLSDETSLDFIRKALTLSEISPAQISFEITETAAVRNIAKTRSFMDELRCWGCRFALDDFGSGVSSLTYLKRLPVDFLKIDGSFVRDMTKDFGSQAMVKAIGQMAEDIGIKTIAEGVEDLATLDVLKNLGIDYVQGYAIGHPAPFSAKPAPLSSS